MKLNNLKFLLAILFIFNLSNYAYAAKNNVISTPFAMWGVSIIFIGLFLYLCGVFIASINKGLLRLLDFPLGF